jgi:hypothetical protein
MLAPAPTCHTGTPRARIRAKYFPSKVRGRNSRLKLHRRSSALRCASLSSSPGSTRPVTAITRAAANGGSSRAAHSDATTTSSSVKATIAPVVARTPVLRAMASPGRGSRM